MRTIGGGCARLCLSLGLAWVTPAAASEPAKNVIEVRRSVDPDPDVRSGVLANGMRYSVRHSAMPVGGLSLRLGFDVGSFEEQDNERGFAHFIEHLAFRKTRSAPEGGLDVRFAKLGVAFGRDQNARTTAFATTYRLDFKSTDAHGIDEGFRWLRDVADGVTLSDDVIASEHGVVIAEQVSSDGEAKRVGQAVARFQAPELRSTFHQPDELPRSLAVIKKDALQGFYDRWYRPENAVVIAVGNQPIADLEKLIRAHFEGWQNKGPVAPRALNGRVNVDRGLDAFTLGAPSFPKVASACRLQAPPAPGGEELPRLGREIRQSIWRGILNERIKRLINDGKSGLLGGEVVTNENQEVAVTCFVAIPTGDEWPKALAATQLELLRFAKDGPTDSELEAQVEEQRSSLRAAISNADGQTAATMAETILDRALDRRPVLSPAEAMHAFDVVVEDLDPAAVKAAFNADWSGEGPLLMLTLPTKAETAKLRAAWLQNAKGAPLPTYADLAAVTWPYADFGKAGTVISREEIARPGFTRFRFSNGVILNFKRRTTEPNSVDVRARFGGGRKQIANDDLLTATFGAGMLITGGLGRLPAADIERAFRNVSWQFEFDIKNESFEFSKSGLTDNLPTVLDVFAAYMSDPGFRSDSDARIPDAVDMVFRGLSTEPLLALSEAMMGAIDPGNPERMPSKEEMAAFKSTEFARVLKGPITSEAVELTIVGDVEEAVATELVGKTLGALPARQYADRKRSDTHFLRFPDHAFPIIRATHGGAAERSAARLVWPLYVATPERRREEFALNLVAAIFNEGLRRRIRSELGKTYDPQVATQMPDYADQGLLAADIAAQPADIDALVAEAQSLAAKLASGAITADDVEAIRRPMLSALGSAREKNSWWAAAMDGSARKPETIDEVMGYRDLMASITLDEVKSAASKWLSAKPIIGISLPKPPVQSTASSTANGGANGARNRRVNP